MSCDNSCGPLVVTIYTGVPGTPGTLGAVSGDITVVPDGGTNVTTVVGIRGRPVANVTPSTNQIYQYTGTQWMPVDYTAGTY